MEDNSIKPQSVINAFLNLGSSCKQTQRKSNSFLMNIMNQPEVWLISQDLLRQEKYSSYKLLGAQLFYRKLQRDIQFLQKSVLQQLKKFIFCYFELNYKKPPIRRLLAAAYTLIICQLSNQHIKHFFSEIHEIMKKPNGIILALSLIKQFPIEAQNTNTISKSKKHELFEELMKQKKNLQSIFLVFFSLKQYQEQSIEACQFWINYGFSLIQSSQIVKIILQILKSECEEEIFNNACSLLARAIQIEKNLSLRNFKIFYEANDFKQQVILSLRYLASFFEQIQFSFQQTAQSQYQNNKPSSLLNIVYKLLINFQFLIGIQSDHIFQRLLLSAIKNKDIRIKIAACQFADKLIESILKIQVQSLSEEFLSKLFDFLSQIMITILPQCAVKTIQLLQSSSLLDQTFDSLDESNISFAQLRKCMAQTLVSYYKLYTFKSSQQGSERFLELISRCIGFIHEENPIKGLDLSVFIMKSLVRCDNFSLYWGQFFNSFIQSLIKDYQEFCKYNRIVEEIFQMANGCESILKSKETANKLYIFLLSFLNQDTMSKDSIKCLQNIIRNSSKSLMMQDFQHLLASYRNSKDTFGEYARNMLQCLLLCITRLSQPNEKKLSMLLDLLESFKCEIHAHIRQSPKIKENILLALKIFVNFCLKQQDFLESFYGKFMDQTITLCYSIFSSILTAIKSPSDQINYILVIEEQTVFLITSFNLLKYLTSNKGLNNLLIIFDIITKDFIDRFEQRLFKYIPINIFSKGLIKLNKERNQVTLSWLLNKNDRIIGCYKKIVRQAQFNEKHASTDAIRSAYLYIQSVITYNKQLYLAQQNHQNDFFLYGLVIFQTISETSLQIQMIAYFKACFQLNLYDNLLDSVFYSLFSSIKLIISSKVSQLLAELLSLVFERASNKSNCDMKIILRNIFQFDFLSSIDEGIKSIMMEYFYVALTKSSLNDKSKPIRELSYILKSEVGVNYIYPLKRKLENFRKVQSSLPEKSKMEVEK